MATKTPQEEAQIVLNLLRRFPHQNPAVSQSGLDEVMRQTKGILEMNQGTFKGPHKILSKPWREGVKGLYRLYLEPVG